MKMSSSRLKSIKTFKTKCIWATPRLIRCTRPISSARMTTTTRILISIADNTIQTRSNFKWWATTKPSKMMSNSATKAHSTTSANQMARTIEKMWYFLTRIHLRKALEASNSISTRTSRIRIKTAHRTCWWMKSRARNRVQVSKEMKEECLIRNIITKAVLLERERTPRSLRVASSSGCLRTSIKIQAKEVTHHFSLIVYSSLRGWATFTVISFWVINHKMCQASQIATLSTIINWIRNKCFSNSTFRIYKINYNNNKIKYYKEWI